MYVKTDKLDIYNDSAIILDKKIPKKIISWITILIILMILFVVFSFVPFNIYKTFVGYIYIEDNNSYVVLSINESDFPINKNNKLYIQNKKYDYEVVMIQEDKLVLNINLDDNLKIQDNQVLLNILKNRTTLFEIIKNKIKRGFGV
ncbi:MAG: hypothetical protein E7174_04060 [Firmicutes bacterium]|nr:hypothetical protein [Bacillota bacterium]